MNKAFEKILEFIDEQIKIEESIAKSENEGHPITHQYGANCMNVIKKMLTIENIKEYAESDGFINLNNCRLMIFEVAEQLKAGGKE